MPEDIGYIETVERVRHFKDRQVAEHYRIYVPGTFQSMYEAKRWLGDNGYSWGDTCFGNFCGLLRGRDIYIAKWNKLTNAEKKALHGVISSTDYREGIVEVFIFTQ